MVGNEVFLSDTKSKFGSLVQVQRTIPLREELNGLEI